MGFVVVLRVLVVGVLLAGGLVGLSGPARAARGLVLMAGTTGPVVGGAVVLRARMDPARRGRVVTFERRSGSSWKALGRARTSHRGVASMRARFGEAGSVTVRAVTLRFRGDRRRVSAPVRLRVVKAPTFASATWPAGPWGEGSSVRVPVAVVPQAAGREVWLERLGGAGWTRASAVSKTGSGGRASIDWSAQPAGAAAFRVVVGATPVNEAAATAAVSRTVQAASAALGLEAPEWVTTGQVFEATMRVGRLESSLRNAVLTVTVPRSGEQVRPPADLHVDSDTGQAMVLLGTVAAGADRRVPLRWKAPTAAGTLTVQATLTADGVRETKSVQVPVLAAPAGGGAFGPQLRAFRETRSAPVVPEAVSFFCTQVWQRPSIPSFAEAKVAAQAYVTSAMDPAHAEEWKSLPALEDPALIDELVLVAHLDSRPGAVLAASLRGHELAPNDPVHLANAAAAANMLEHPEWAIAFAQQAGKLAPAPAVGVTQEAMRLATLGHAWSLRGEHAKAEQALRAAVAVAPDSMHIQHQLGVILACADQQEDALSHLRRGLRVDDTGDSAVDPEHFAYRFSRVGASEAFDLSGATASEFQPPMLPTSMGQLVAMGPYDGSGYYQAEADQIKASYTEAAAQVRELDEQWRMASAAKTSAQISRTRDILNRISVYGDRSLIESYESLDTAWDAAWHLNSCDGEFRRHIYCAIDGRADDCAQTRMLFEEWARRITTHQSAFAAYHAVAWPIFSGLQANLSDPIAHELAGAKAREAMLFHANVIAGNLALTARVFEGYNDSGVPGEGTCTMPEVPAQAPRVQVGGAGAAPCQPGSLESRLAYEIDVVLLKVKASCEKLTVEAGVGIPGLMAFAKVEKGWDTNGATAFVGVKGEIPRVGSFDSAFFVETTGNGSISDFGIEVGPEIEAEPIPGVKVTVWQDKIRMGLMSTHATPAS